MRYTDPSGHAAAYEGGTSPVSYAKCGSKGDLDTILAIYSEQNGELADGSGVIAIPLPMVMSGGNIETFPLEALAGKEIVEVLTSSGAILALLAILIYPVITVALDPDHPLRLESFPTWEDYRDVLSGPTTIPTNTLEFLRDLHISKAEDADGEGSGESADNKTNGAEGLSDEIAEWLGANAKVKTNSSGDKVFLSEDGLRKIRFDINNPRPHNNPHVHIKELVNGKWRAVNPNSKQIYPIDVPHD